MSPINWCIPRMTMGRRCTGSPGSPAPRLPPAWARIWEKYWGYISSAGTAPVWLGEFGTDNTAADIQSATAGSQGQWFESLVAYLQSNSSISWTYWALNGEDSYGLLDSNYDSTPQSSTKQSLLQGIQ